MFLQLVLASWYVAAPISSAGVQVPVKPAAPRIAWYRTPGATNPAFGDQLLVGIILNGREVGALDVLRNVDFFLPLREFAELTACRLVDSQELGSIQLETPIGRAVFYPPDFIEVGGVRYLSQSAIADKLASPVVFDQAAFALRIDLAWRRPAPASASAPVRLIPDQAAPANSLSTIRIDAQYRDSEFRERSFNNRMLLTGRLLDGFWQARLQSDFEDNSRLQDYAWLRRDQDRLWLVGHQRIRLHPLLPGLELTGGQLAWTNQPLDLFPTQFRPGELLPRRLRAADSYEGVGPPAGVAELRIEGRVISRTAIGLDGRYAFYDVALPNRQLSQVEIYLYERHNEAVPVAIEDRSRSASDLLLSDGAMVQQVGAGYGGNLVQDALDDGESSAAAGFYQGRWGLREGLTLEAAAQQDEHGGTVMGGFTARLSPATIFSLGLGSARGAGAVSAELDGVWPRWSLRGRTRLDQSGYQQAGSEERFDHVLELAYVQAPRLTLGVVARSRRQPDERDQFILPMFAWRPWPGMAMRARPDERGDYVADLFWLLGRNARAGAHYQNDRVALDYTHRLSRGYKLFAGAQFGGQQARRYSAALRRVGDGRWQPTWTAGWVFSEREVGFNFGLSVNLRPGIRLQFDWEDDPMPFDSLGNRNQRLFIGLTADLAYSGGRFLPGRSDRIRLDRGAIAGRVRVSGPLHFAADALSDLPVRVDGRIRARTAGDGSFFVGDLPEGIYHLDLDSENLPIELTPERSIIAVEVAGAAVTRVDFAVRPEFGIAGRVSDTGGVPLTGVEVELLDAAGQRVQSAITDRFGLFRIHGLAVGSYWLQTKPGVTEAAAPKRRIEISDDFLFGQDLLVPDSAAEPP